jgi:hypothetical protein
MDEYIRSAVGHERSEFRRAAEQPVESPPAPRRMAKLMKRHLGDDLQEAEPIAKLLSDAIGPCDQRNFLAHGQCRSELGHYPLDECRSINPGKKPMSTKSNAATAASFRRAGYARGSRAHETRCALYALIGAPITPRCVGDIPAPGGGPIGGAGEWIWPARSP